MNKHLFLEGPIEIGKSTLIREVIRPYLNYVGGFSSQRIRMENQEICGHRLVPATNLQLDIPYTLNLPGVFKQHYQGIIIKKPQVFESLGVDYLLPSLETKLFLLDEIGGSELLVPNFCTALYEVLQGETPCMGVIKNPENTVAMCKKGGYPSILIEKNQQLREDLQLRFNGKIISYTKENHLMLKKELIEFLKKSLL